MISLENVSKRFGTGVFGLTNVSFKVEKGEFAFLVGPTGSGKTTVMRMLIREVTPTQGTIVVNTWNIIRLPNRKVPELRKMIGVIFQDLKLLPDRTILENTALPLELSGVKTKDAQKKAQEILKSVGILEHASKFPIQLSGGEKQRAAIARALILQPKIILADEPTGDLDDDTAWEIINLLKKINETGTTILMATHNANFIKKLNKRTIKLNKGVLMTDNNLSHGKEPKVEHQAQLEPKKEDKEHSTKSMREKFEHALRRK